MFSRIDLLFRSSRPAIRRSSRRSVHAQPALESLEDRVLLSNIALNDGTLSLNGSNAAETLVVSVTPNNSLLARIIAGGQVVDSEVHAANTVNRVAFRGFGGHDRLVNHSSVAGFMFGGAGNDHLIGGQGVGSQLGEGGDDHIVGRNGRDRGIGGAGDDVIVGGNGADRAIGGDGDDFIRGNAGNDTLEGRDGNDRVLGEAGFDIVHGGIGNDILQGGTQNDRLRGDRGFDILYGDSGNDQLDGHDENDRLLGGTGNDVLIGRLGNDLLTGGAGDDRLLGGAGTDTVVEAADAHFTIVSVSDSLLTGQLFGQGQDELDRVERADLTGGEGVNIFNAAAFLGSVTLRGMGGTDILLGGIADDRLFGGPGIDVLVGNLGNDHLDGGPGFDIQVPELVDDILDQAPLPDLTDVDTDIVEDVLQLVSDLHDSPNDLPGTGLVEDVLELVDNLGLDPQDPGDGLLLEIIDGILDLDLLDGIL